MDNSKVGNLISQIRKEKEMTQKQLAEVLMISDRTVSKWERGLGCPDVSLLHALSGVLGVNLEKLLQGDLEPNIADGGNMKKLKFYVCPTCGNLITSTGEAELSCCGLKLSALKPKQADADHHLNIQQIENDYYITFDHEMRKDHYLNFIAFVTYDRVLMVKLYPEQNGEVRFPKMNGGMLYYCCTRHGLYRYVRQPSDNVS